MPKYYNHINNEEDEFILKKNKKTFLIMGKKILKIMRSLYILQHFSILVKPLPACITEVYPEAK